MEPIRITSGRHPFEVILLIASPVVASVLVLTNTQPPAVKVAMPTPVRAVWFALLIVAGAAGLTGVFWRGQVGASLSIEAIGVLVLGAAASMYAFGLLAVSGVQGAAAAGFVAAVATGSWWRLTQIWRDLRKLDRAVAEQAEQAVLAEQARQTRQSFQAGRARQAGQSLQAEQAPPTLIEQRDSHE
ncbi:hypothetical protein [Rugosimonospora africana]|uniref:Transmembrane protein n=1 Tax=Rugosimonospora africana TaxID=556532 RepID=A0A8J3QY76_9ACTN|nr:hypothetical protein [Rugosimonospora africana]GIH18449.1 hypothetical protein Raf01_66210 [Rugosimonospora africana]